ncbi:MAG: hypothetical protein ABEH40_08030 [Haloferacaceae archaeon]
MADRGQLSLPVVEVAIGVVLIVGVSVAFAVDVPGPGREEAQLERYAEDAAAGLAATPVRAADEEGPLVGRALESGAAFAQHRDRLRRRADRLVPPTVRIRLLTRHGTLGPPRPPGATVGRARLPTAAGTLTVEVWYG